MRDIQLPTGPRPGWELDESFPEDAELKSIPESMVVLSSLRQSRSKWTSTIFPKFSVKTRGGRPAEVTPPPHTTKAHGKYDLHIGPHVFSDTAIYEVHYLPVTEPQAMEAPITMHQGTTTLPSNSSGVQSSLSSIAFPSGTYVTPALSSKVTAAAQSNPVLANLLNAVINRTATDDQVKTLGLLIQSLEGVQSVEQPAPTPVSQSAPLAQVPSRPSSPKPFDIVLEFQERPSDRFIFPRGEVVCELAEPKAGAPHRGSDLIITCCLPFPRTGKQDLATQTTEQPEDPPKEIVSFRFSRVSQSLWEMLSTWAGSPQEVEENRMRLAELVKQASPRTYLQHRLPDDELLEEIQAAMAPSYTMKPIKPAGADSNRAKRKSVSRKPAVVISTPPVPAAASTSAPPAPPAPSDKPQPVKRRSQPKTKAPAPPPIACHSCGQTDVPLMMGGRYCRECINAGKASADIPQVQPSRAPPVAYSPYTFIPSTGSAVQMSPYTHISQYGRTGTYTPPVVATPYTYTPPGNPTSNPQAGPPWQG